MPAHSFPKIKSLTELYARLTENEKIIVDVLRNLVKDNLPAGCKEKISYNVPYFHGRKGICIIWPASIPRGGIKTGVLLGFWYGNKLNDKYNYLEHGSNKQVYYKIFHSPEEIEQGEENILHLLKEAIKIDGMK